MSRTKDPYYRFHKARNCAVVAITNHDLLRQNHFE